VGAQRTEIASYDQEATIRPSIQEADFGKARRPAALDGGERQHRHADAGLD